MENLRARLNRVAPRGGSRMVSQLASSPSLRVHEAEVSRWLAGAEVPAIKADAMLAALTSLEELYDADPVRIDMRDVENVRTALARLAEKRAAELADLSAPSASVSFEQDARRHRAEAPAMPLKENLETIRLLSE